jgi:prefoldin subunit 5
VNTLNKTYPFLIAAVVVVAIGAPLAQGTGKPDPAVAALTAKVKALQARVASLEAKATALDDTSAAAKNDIAAAKDDIAAVKGTLGTTQQGVAALQSGASALQSTVAGLQSAVGSLNTCLRYGAMPVARYNGYVYTTNGGTTLYTTSALDSVDAGQTPSSYLARVNPSCVSSAFAVQAVSRERLALDPAFIH